MRDINRAAREIARKFNPQRITLFGSYAYGRPTANSDVDFLVLMNGKHVHDDALRIREAIDFGFPVDVLVRSPEEFEWRISNDDGFLKEIDERGKVLYEASHSGMGSKSGRRLRDRSARSSRTKITKSR